MHAMPIPPHICVFFSEIVLFMSDCMPYEERVRKEKMNPALEPIGETINKSHHAFKEIISPKVYSEPTSIDKTRVPGYDFARSLAILGMILVNFSLAMEAEENGHSLSGFIVDICTGRASALFVVLAGIGISLMTRRAVCSQNLQELRGVREKLLKRALFLFLFGLVFSRFWYWDILHFYGVYFAVAACLITISSRGILFLGGASIAVKVALAALMEFFLNTDYSGVFTSDALYPFTVFKEILYDGLYPVFPWFAFLFFGIWLGRKNLDNPRIRNRLFALSLVILAGSEWLSHQLMNSVYDETDGGIWSFMGLLFNGTITADTPLYVVSGSASSLFIITASIMVTQRFARSFWIQPFILTGRMSLTIYVMHACIGMILMAYFDFFNLKPPMPLSVYYSLLFFTTASFTAYFWLHRKSHGPLEHLIRWASQ